jgi:SAM-dependent methyltransferase
MEDTTVAFYDGLAADYHLVYGDRWDVAVARQGAVLEWLIRRTHADARDVLDCSCGIGTQAIGLALRGFRVHGTDASPRSIERARSEAARLGADVTFGVDDFRRLDSVAGDRDVVISCDNSIPHLLDADDIPRALSAMRAKLRPGGLLVVSVRDYDSALVDRAAAAPPLLIEGPPRRLFVRMHDWDGPDSRLYTVRFFVLTESGDRWTLAQHEARYRAITSGELGTAAAEAGFTGVAWHAGADIAFHQPVMTAVNPEP